MEKPFHERRRHPRIYRNFILVFHEKGSATQQDISQINNISQSGVCFIATRRIKEGTTVILDLKTSFMVDPIHLEGVVKESREKVAEMIYETRIQFTHTPEQALNILKKIESFGNP